MNIDTTITWKSFSLYFCVATCYVHMHGSSFTRAGYEISEVKQPAIQNLLSN